MSTPLRERPDAPLGTLIFRAGLLPAETIENALEEGVKTGRRLGEILIERGLLQEEDLTRLLAGQKGLPFVNLRSEQIDHEATRLLSEDQARLFGALPIRFEEGLPLVAVADPTNDVLNRNIREALGQDVRFVVAGRSDLNDVIGEAYSGTLRTVMPQPAPGPAGETEPEVEMAPLRVDTTVAPAAEAPAPPAYEPEPAPQPEPEPEPEPATLEPAQPKPVFEAPVHDAPAHEAPPAIEPDPEPVFEPQPEPAPEPEPETAFEPATFEAPTPSTELETPAPAFEPPPAPEPVAPPAAEPAVEQSLPETNGQLPHELEDDLPPPQPTTPAAEPALAASLPETPHEPATANGSGFTVSVRLTSGERLTVAECADVGEAKGYAKALTKQLGTTEPDDWPFVNGRFLKPDTILSVDVEQN